jgi:hypothetical protein
MKKYLLILLAIFIVPSIAFASWWNPFTWFQKQPQTEQTISVANKSTVLIPNTTTAPNTTSNTVSKTAASSAKKITKTNTQICIEKYGLHNYADGTKNASGAFACVCESNYAWNGKQCIPAPSKTTPTQTPAPVSTPTAVTETGYQACSNAFPDETWDGTYTSNGKYNCVCIAGYVSNSAGTACVSASSSELITLQSKLQMYQNELASGQAEVQKYKNQWDSQNCSDTSASLDADSGQGAVAAQTQAADCAIIMQAENDTYNVEVAPIQNDIAYIQQEISNLQN